MSPEKTNGGSFTQRWRQGQLASNSSVKTVVLALMLVITIFIAHTIVNTRSAPYLKLEKARENAADIIDYVSQQGLRTYFGTEQIIRYHIIEEQGFSPAYGISYLQSWQTENGNWICKGGELRYYPVKNIFVTTSFAVADNLAGYTYRTNILHTVNKRSIVIGQEQICYQGLLSGSYISNNIVIPIKQNNFGNVVNLVPPPLLDFFSSIAAIDDPDGNAAFTYPNFVVTEKRHLMIEWPEVLVATGQDVPDEIVIATPGGQSVETKWYSTASNDGQHIRYDQQHQLYWQQDFKSQNNEPTAVLKTVTREELLDAFPNAQSLIERLPGDNGQEQFQKSESL